MPETLVLSTTVRVTVAPGGTDGGGGDELVTAGGGEDGAGGGDDGAGGGDDGGVSLQEPAQLQPRLVVTEHQRPAVRQSWQMPTRQSFAHAAGGGMKGGGGDIGSGGDGETLIATHRDSPSGLLMQSEGGRESLFKQAPIISEPKKNPQFVCVATRYLYDVPGTLY